ncbi:hypothetical protein C8F01DRAFT_1172103, partial [Mycena amicta]
MSLGRGWAWLCAARERRRRTSFARMMVTRRSPFSEENEDAERAISIEKHGFSWTAPITSSGSEGHDSSVVSSSSSAPDSEAEDDSSFEESESVWGRLGSKPVGTVFSDGLRGGPINCWYSGVSSFLPMRQVAAWLTMTDELRDHVVLGRAWRRGIPALFVKGMFVMYVMVVVVEEREGSEGLGRILYIRGSETWGCVGLHRGSKGIWGDFLMLLDDRAGLRLGWCHCFQYEMNGVKSIPSRPDIPLRFAELAISQGCFARKPP